MESIEKLWCAPRFDWYEGTFKGLRIDADTVVADALTHWDMSSVVQVRPRNGVYMRACEIVRGSMCILHLCWGGYNEGVHFIASGAVSHEVWEWLNTQYQGMYSVSRADVRQDCTTEGMWDYVYKEAERFALNRRIKCRHVGDYLTAKMGARFTWAERRRQHNAGYTKRARKKVAIRIGFGSNFRFVRPSLKIKRWRQAICHSTSSINQAGRLIFIRQL